MLGIKHLTYFSFLLAILLLGCNVDAVRVQIAPYELMHDNASKVWLLKHQIIDGEETVPEKRADRWVLVFYKDNTFVLSDLKSFGEYSMYQGHFSISNDIKVLTFHWKTGEKYKYDLIEANNSRLRFNLKKADQLIEYEYVTIDKRVLNYDEINKKEYEESIYY